MFDASAALEVPMGFQIDEKQHLSVIKNKQARMINLQKERERKTDLEELQNECYHWYFANIHIPMVTWHIKQTASI